MKNVIRLGDPTNHGGRVVTAALHYKAFGKPVARVGDMCVCPIPGHQACFIVEGDASWTIDGRAVALNGCKTSCGASLISTLSAVGGE